MNFRTSQLLQDRAVPGETFARADSSFARNKRRRFLELQIVEFCSRLPGDFKHVLETLGGDEQNFSAASLQQRVRSDCGSADQVQFFLGLVTEHCAYA